MMNVAVCRTLMLCTVVLLLASSARSQTYFEDPMRLLPSIATLTVNAADINGDGFADIVTLPFSGDKKIVTFLGDGLGGFGQPIEGPSAQPAADAAIADFDGDGHLDSVHCGDASVVVLAGLGNGTFELRDSYEFYDIFGLQSLAVADFNEDGNLDVVVGVADVTSKIAIFFGDGSGNLGVPVVSEFEVNDFVHAADFTNDGHVDLAVTFRSQVLLLVGDGAGNLTPVAPSRSLLVRGDSLASADIDGDGTRDLVVDSNDSTRRGVTVMLGDGAGGLDEPTFFDTGFAPTEIELRDLDGDGACELITSGVGSGTISIFPGEAGGLFGSPRGFLAGNGALAFALADFDGEGTLDVAVNVGSNSSAGGGIAVLYTRPDGQLDASEASPICALPEHATVADFNKDGRPDLAVASRSSAPSAVAVYLRDDRDAFVESAFLPVPFALSGVVATGDFNADGSVDLMVGTHAAFVIFRGDGSGGFVEQQTIAADRVSDSIAVGSFNDLEDDYLDFVSISAGRWLVLYVGDGAGNFTYRSSTDLVRRSTRDMAIADFDGDGHLDFVSARGVFGFGTGTGTFMDVGDRVVESLNVEVGDINGDSRLDLVFGLESGGVVTYLGSGSRQFADGPVTEHPWPVLDLDLVDMDNDGVLDLAEANSFISRVVRILKGDGTGRFLPERHVAVSYGVHHVIAQDMTADGWADLVCFDFSGQSVVLRTNLTPLGRCRPGTVNAGVDLGSATDVLFVNGFRGLGDRRRVVVDRDDPFEIRLDAAPADSQSTYAFYAWLDVPENSDTRLLPASVGMLCLPGPLTDASPARLKRTWNNTGNARLGESDFPAPLAPAVVFSRPAGLGLGTTLYLQGVISDSGSLSPRGFSTTNGVEVLSF